MLAKGALVWVPSAPTATEPFQLATVVSSEPDLVVRLNDDKEVSPPAEDVFLANATMESDSVALLSLSDATLLANTRARFDADEIYTWTGQILTSVNPCKPLPHLYDAAAMKASLALAAAAQRGGRSEQAAAPHLFATAERAYTALIEGGANQSIVVSGISGAGKTEAIKHIMRYLCWRTGNGADDGETERSSVAQLVMDSNPVFEALGNATTINNPNSSRFGKFIRMRFGADGAVVGAVVDTYLLEKSRLSAQQPSERNFHIFYQLLAGMPEAELCAAGLKRDGTYRYLGGTAVGAATTTAASQQALVADFEATTHAMSALGIDTEATVQVLTGLLHLGNVTFEPKCSVAARGSEHREGVKGGDDEAEGSVVSEASQAALEHASRLLGVRGLSSILTTRSVQAGGGRRSMYEVQLSPEDASFTRDALAKKIYERVFDESVTAINRVLEPASKPLSSASSGSPLATASGPASSSSYDLRSVGLLDIFGFEIFPTNGFEQLMVNLANEKLQRFFLDGIFRREQAEYQAEALPWIPIVDVPDNTACIATIEARPHGVLPLLDEQCRLGSRGTDGALSESLNAHNPGCLAAIASLDQRGRKAFRPADAFTVTHFVQPVTYTACDFLERNRDTFFQDLSRALIASDKPLVQRLLKPEEVATESELTAHGTGRSYRTVASGFTSQLGGLIAELTATDAGFVRCIKPNSTLTPAAFDARMVLHQLRTCGMLQAVQMMMAMYGARIRYDDILAWWRDPKYGPAAELPSQLEGLAAISTVQAICAAFDVPPYEYAFGTTRLFFRAGRAVGLTAFCRAAANRDEALARSALLRWKLPMAVRERHVGEMVAAWLHRARSRLLGEAAATMLELASAKANRAQSDCQAGSDGSVAMAPDAERLRSMAMEPAEARAASAARLARLYRHLRRGYAVSLVQARAATRIAKHARGHKRLSKYVLVRQATPALQLAWRRKLRRDLSYRMATRLQAWARRTRQLLAYRCVRGATLQIQTASRALFARSRFHAVLAAYLARATPAARQLQAMWRASSPQRYFRAAKAAAVVIAATYRMMRIRRLHQRVLDAAAFLQGGGSLEKYKYHTRLPAAAAQERHERHVKLSKDMRHIVWTRPPTEGVPAHEKSIPVSSICAVTDGAKTTLMKKMHQRVENASSHPNVGRALLHKTVPAMKPHDLDLSLAFSIIAKERTLDFVAPTTELRDAWLSNLSMLLVNQATLDTTKVMQRGDVLVELRMMSFQICRLRKRISNARLQVQRETSRLSEFQTVPVPLPAAPSPPGIMHRLSEELASPAAQLKREASLERAALRSPRRVLITA